VEQLAGMTRRQPVLVIYEDVHWADPTTIELIDLIIDRVRTLPALVVITFRPEFTPRWIGLAHITLLSLSRLGGRQGAAMVEHLTGGKPFPAEVPEQIVKRTDGVPLFVEELTKSVLELGLLKEEAGSYALAAPLPPLAIPSTLQDSLMARLDCLAPVREVAQIGAVIGREFSHELLATVVDLSEAALDDAMSQLVAAGLVFRRGAGSHASYIFKHALVQDAAYNSLLISRRQQLHGRIAQVVEERFADIAAADPAVLAHHFAQAGHIDKAVEYHERAGRRAIGKSMVAEALAEFDRALELLHGSPPSKQRQRRELGSQLALGSAHEAIHGFAARATGDAYRRAAELCDELNETRELFAVLYGLCLYHLYGAELASAKVVGERLLKLAEPTDDHGLLFFAHRAAGVSALPAGDFSKAQYHLEQALKLYDPGEHRTPAFIYAFDPRVVCLDYLARALLPLGFPERALAANDEAVREARLVSHRNSLALTLFFGGVVHQIIGDREGVENRSRELADIAADAGLRFWQAGATVLSGWALAETGGVDDGRAEMKRGIDEWRATGAEYMLPYFLSLLAQIELRAGRLQAALSLLKEAQSRVERTGERWFEAEIFRIEGEVLSILGRLVDTKTSLLRALETAAKQQARFWELRAAVSRVRIDHDVSARERVKHLCADFSEGFGLLDFRAAQSLTLDAAS
jgi:predicted ATPase